MADYTVVLESNGGCEVDMFDFDTEDEAREFCNAYGWLWEDENGFVWEMTIRHNWLDKMLELAE